MTTNGPKWPQNTVFGRVKKLVSWVLSRIAVKRQFLWFINILWRLETECLEKFLSSSYNRRFLLASETSVFFKYQYLYNRSSSDFEIWHVDRHEWKEQGLVTGFLKKNYVVANTPFMAQEMAHPHHSGSPARSFFKLLHTEKCQ